MEPDWKTKANRCLVYSIITQFNRLLFASEGSVSIQTVSSLRHPVKPALLTQNIKQPAQWENLRVNPLECLGPLSS